MSGTRAGARTIALLLESDGPGGAERVLLQLAEELRRRGHDVVPVGPAAGCGWLAGEFRGRGFQPETFTLRRPVDPWCALGLRRTLARRRVDVVHSHEFTMAVYGAAAARLVGRPHVMTLHGGRAFETRRRRRVALRWACRHSAAVVGVSRPVADHLVHTLGLAPGSVTVVPNGIRPDPGQGEGVRQELGIQPGELLLLAVGNLYPVKGHEVLLRALGRLAADTALPPWRLAIAGRGEEEEGLRRLAADSGISNRVHLLGYRADVADLLAAADIFVLPSRSEGLPLALLEAMFAEKPVVASGVGGIPAALESGEEGLLVPPGDPEALAGALRGLLADPARRSAYAAAARRRAEGEFTVEAMVDAYERLYAGAGT